MFIEQFGVQKTVYFDEIQNVVGWERFLENIVFLELKRRYKEEIYYYQGKKECDFVLRKGRTIFAAIQVCQHLEDADTKAREYAGLLEAIEIYGLDTGLILTENNAYEETITVNGRVVQITVRPIWEWLYSQKTHNSI